MTSIFDLVDEYELEAMENAGRVRVRVGEHGLFIANYTNKAQFANEWTNTERVCRGLIFDAHNKVIARGVPKFFNYGDPRIGEEVTDDTIVEAYTKYDGSLGICYVQPDGQVAVATRGSFASEQAIVATSLLRDGGQRVNPSHVLEAAEYGRTILVEIIYPQNKIVVDYGETSMLRLLGWVDNQTGGFDPSFGNLRFTGPLYQLMKKGVDRNEEGYVCQTRTGNLFKVKGEEYKRLHTLIFGLSNKTVWELLTSENGYVKFVEFRNQVPAPIGIWLDREYRKLQIQQRKFLDNVNLAVTKYTANDPTRKELALRLQANCPELLPLVFTYIDGGYPALIKQINKAIRPKDYRPYAVEPQED